MVYARTYFPLALCFLVCIVRCPIVSCNEDHDHKEALIVDNDSYENYDVVSSHQISKEDDDDDDNKSYLRRTILKQQKNSDLVVLNETKSSSNKRVKVNIYDESLCIDCQLFILKILVPTYEELGPSIMDLSLVSFGNARYMNVSTTVIDNTDTVIELETINNDISKRSDDVNEILVCQHGIAECDTNVYNLCVADIYKYNIDRYLPYVACLFERLPMGYKNDSLFDISVYASCAQDSVVDWYSIKKCHSDKVRVRHLEQIAYQSTPKDHKYVPWIVVNDVHYEMDDNMDVATFKNMICTTFTKNGGKHPACSGTITTFQNMIEIK